MSESHRDDFTYQTSNLILFVFQMLIILVVVSMSIYNLTFQQGDTSMWTALLSSSIGYVLPNPKLKFNENRK
jgi:hypothetical protein